MFGAWTSHLPARVGQSKALDSAVESLIAAHEGRLSHNTKTANDCSRKYTAAISNVREAVLREPYSDNTLLAVGLCVSTEVSSSEYLPRYQQRLLMLREAETLQCSDCIQLALPRSGDLGYAKWA